jgi:predicted MFS family arabinose efflux permease
MGLGPALPPGWRSIIAIVAMASGPAMTGMMLTIVLPMLPQMANEVIGGRNVLIALPTFGIVVGGITAGMLIDKMSTRTLMLRMMVAFGIVGFAGMILTGIPLLASRFLMGVISTCISAASTTLIAEHIHIEKRPRVFGFQMAGGSAAGIVAMNAAGFIDDAFGWRAAFVLFPLIGGITFIAGALLIPHAPKPVAAVPSEAEQKTHALLRPLHATGRVLAAMWPLYLALLLMHATAYTNNSQTPFVLTEDGINSAGVRSLMLSLGHLMIVTAALCYPITRRILGSRWIPAFFLTLMTSGLLLLGLSNNLVLAGVALGLLGFGNGTLFPHQSNLVVGRAPPALRGRAVGLMVSNQFLADTINPFIFPPMIAVMGLHYSVATIGLLAAGGVVIALIYGSRTSNIEMPAGAGAFGH